MSMNEAAGPPLEVRVQIRVQIRRVADGVTRTDNDSIGFSGETREAAQGHAVYWWAEGNGSCDCNRERFFCAAEDEDVDDDRPCTDGLFKIKVEDPETGAVLIDEFEP